MLTLPERMMYTAVCATGYRAVRVATSVGQVHVLEREGAGRLPDLVFLHGVGSAALHLTPWMRHFRRHVRRVVAPDLPGHGLTGLVNAGSDGRHGLTPDRVHRGISEALDSLIVEPAVLVGNSLGGLAAIRYALDRPARVRALVLLSPGGAPMGEEDLAALKDSLVPGSHGEALDFVDRVYARPPRAVMRTVLAAGVRSKLGHPHVRSLLRHTTAETLLTAEEAQSLKMPVLLFWGDRDRVLPDSHREFFAQNLTSARIEYAPGLGHSPYLEEPRRVADIVLEFVRSIAEAPAGGP